MMRQSLYVVHRSGKRRPTWRRILALLAVGAFLTACAGQGSAGEGTAEATTVGDVLSDPAQYRGQQLTLSGEVRSVLSPEAFRMQEAREGLFSGVPAVDGLLVVIAEGAQRPPDVDDGMALQVTGEMRTYDPATFEATPSFDPALHEVSEGDPLLLADQVLISATISDIDEDPSAYAGSQVTVSGRVGEVLQQGIVRLEGLAAGGDILVIVSEPAAQASLQEGQQLQVTGEVRQFNLDELEGDLDLDLDAGLFAGWASRVVILAESVREV